MIKLKRKETIEVFQTEITLKKRDKKSPFIAVLMLAQEMGDISSMTLQEHLFESMPERACDNLLQMLLSQGYLEPSGYFENFRLTEFGKSSAESNSFWNGEKGLYDVYVCHSALIEPKIIKIKEVNKAENNISNAVKGTPDFIRECEKNILTLIDGDILIEEVEGRCIKLKELAGRIELQAENDDCSIRIYDNAELLYSGTFESDEELIKEHILVTDPELSFDSNRKGILTPFDPEKLALRGKITLMNPTVDGIPFEKTTIENVSFIPLDKDEATKWYRELLSINITNYFLDEQSFIEYSQGQADKFMPYYKLKPLSRKELIKSLKATGQSFYQTAKLETIDYLTY